MTGEPLRHPTIVDTSELRWFAAGVLPAAVFTWFDEGQRSLVIEDRCDTYLVDHRFDTGVKHRFKETLELKVRQSVGELVEISTGLVGAVEQWRRWSPAYGMVELSVDDEWIDVCKLVHKRRFRGSGAEILWTAQVPPDDEVGCDVEIATVTVGSLEAWTFSLAAYGPVSERIKALRVGWDAVVAQAPAPDGFAASLTWACGYPEWLTQIDIGATGSAPAGRAGAEPDEGPGASRTDVPHTDAPLIG